jgi:hypothetical protein
MKKPPIKKLTLVVSALALLAVAGGCSSQQRHSGKEHQTHQRDEVKHISARMRQMHGNHDRMGHVSFTKRDNGLEMHVRLRDTRPETEYMLFAYEMDSADVKEPRTARPAKGKAEIRLPRVTSDANGRVDETFMLTGHTAAEMKNMKVVISRRAANGDMTKVGWGVLNKRSSMF